MFIRVVPPSNIDNRRSIRERIGGFFSAVVDIEVSLELLGFVVTVVAGVGILGYVVVQWAINLIAQGHYATALILVVVSITAVLGTIARIPFAMVVLFGSAVICGTAFLSGASSVVLP